MVRVLAGLLVVAPTSSEDAVRIRATEVVAPCARAAAASYRRETGRPAVVVEGRLREGEADVLIGTSAEITRAAELGLTPVGAEVDIARIPWVISRRAAGAAPVEEDEIITTGEEVWVLAGPFARDARKAVSGLPADRVHESTDVAALRSAPVAVIPLSLAGGRDVGPLDVPPLIVQAAPKVGSPHPRVFLEYLSSEAGQRAFAACGVPRQ